MCNFSHSLRTVPGEETIPVEPVRLLPIEEGRLKETIYIKLYQHHDITDLNHGSNPQISLRNIHLTSLTLGPPGLGVLREINIDFDF